MAASLKSKKIVTVQRAGRCPLAELIQKIKKIFGNLILSLDKSSWKEYIMKCKC
jgi:hypothetical protein